MNQICRVCGEVAAGYHFGAFTCEGCKSFFGRTYNNRSSIGECKNNNNCVINKKNRTSCKSCRLKKCFTVGMSKSGSRYGRRSNWFKIHCLLQDQQQQAASLGAIAGATTQEHVDEIARDLSTSSANSSLTNQQVANYITNSQNQAQLQATQNALTTSLASQLADTSNFLNSTQAGGNPQSQSAGFMGAAGNQQAAAVAAAANYIANGQPVNLTGQDGANSQLYQSALAQLLFYYMISQQQPPQQI